MIDYKAEIDKVLNFKPEFDSHDIHGGFIKNHIMCWPVKNTQPPKESTRSSRRGSEIHNNNDGRDLLIML